STSVFKKRKREFCKKTVETEIMKNKDISRLKKAQRMISEVAKRSRQSRESAKRKLEDEWEDLEDPDDPSYGAGCH
ncbi:hypothetical protein J6590_021216, partial [Homalodisca vitripennis]